MSRIALPEGWCAVASEGGFDTISVLRGVGVGALTAAALIVVATLALYALRQPTTGLPVTAIAIAWVSVFASGFSAARRAGRAGLWHGALAGVLLFAALYLAGVLAYDAPVQAAPLGLRTVIALAVGALGGVIGLAL